MADVKSNVWAAHAARHKIEADEPIHSPAAAPKKSVKLERYGGVPPRMKAAAAEVAKKRDASHRRRQGLAVSSKQLGLIHVLHGHATNRELDVSWLPKALHELTMEDAMKVIGRLKSLLSVRRTW